MGLLDQSSDGSQNALLEFLRANALNQQSAPGGLQSDMANYGQPAPFGLAPTPQQPVQQPQAPMQANPQPSPLDTAAWPAGPVGAPSNANAAMPAPQPIAAVPFSMAGPRPSPTPTAAPAAAPAPAAPATVAAPDSSPGLGDRLSMGAKGFLGNLKNGGILGGLVGGVGSLVSGLPSDPQTIQAQRLAAARGPDGNIDLGKLQQVMLTSGDVASAKTVSDMAGKNTTDLIKNYQFAAANGFKGNLFDYEKALNEAKATKVSTTVNGGEKAFDNAVGKDYGETFVGINKSARDSVGAINNLNILDQLTRNPNFYSGSGADLVKRARQMAVGLGIADADKAAPMELFQKISQKSVLDAAGGSLGTGFSNADRDFLNGTVANLANTPDGNRQIIDIARKVEGRKQEIASEARKYATAHGGRIDAGFDEYLQRWSGAHPLFPAAASPPADYGTNGNAALDQAKAAIAAGAPRDAVVERLKQGGIDPGDL